MVLDNQNLLDETWNDAKDIRRCDLIDKEIQGEITSAEKAELHKLQTQFHEYIDAIAPPPIDGAKRLHAELLKKKREQKGKK